MTAVLADTDILSAFGKVDHLDLLRQLFQHIYVAPAVHRELLQAERMGFSWVDQVTPVVELLPLTADESKEVERLVRQHPQLGSGEVESFVLAQTHQLLCLTNDRQAKAVAHSLSLSYLDLEEILRVEDQSNPGNRSVSRPHRPDRAERSHTDQSQRRHPQQLRASFSCGLLQRTLLSKPCCVQEAGLLSPW